jgi:hypothetical protein
MPRFRSYARDSLTRDPGVRSNLLTESPSCIVTHSYFKISSEPRGVARGRSQRTSPPYFLLFAVDADREIGVPFTSWNLYQGLHEGRPSRLRKCKVMIRAFDSEHWFLITTRYSHDGTRNCAVSEAMGHNWNGPLSVSKLGGRRRTTPVGIVTSEYHYTALAAVEL